MARIANATLIGLVAAGALMAACGESKPADSAPAIAPMLPPVDPTAEPMDPPAMPAANPS